MKSSTSPERSDGLSSRGRLACGAGMLAVALSAGALAVPGASAQSETLHFFQKTVTNTFFNAAGKPIQLNPSMGVPAGDSFQATDLEYVGTAAHHAKQWTATDHLTCVFTAGPAVCNGQIAIGGSMLLEVNEPVQFGPGPVVIKLSGGIGDFAGARGTVTSVSVGTNANLTVKTG